MSVKVGFIGAPEIREKIKQASAEIKQLIDIEVEKTAYKVQAAAVKRIQRSPATGVVYGRHRASKPGEPPASDTGRLASSVQVRKDTDAYIVYTDVEYAAGLEFGTSRVGARPFLFPSVEENRSDFLARLRRVFK